jgi:hypothetical protein
MQVQSVAGTLEPGPRIVHRSAGHAMRISLLVLIVASINGCAGYQLGNATLYRPDIRTVHVPMFQSDSFRRNLGEQLTEAVVKEIELKTPFKVIDDPLAADSVLTGRILSERKRVLAENRNDEPRDIETDIVVQINWYDRRGDTVLADACFTLAQQGFSISQSADFVPEAGQSIATAQQEAFRRIARQVVSQMEAPW